MSKCKNFPPQNDFVNPTQFISRLKFIHSISIHYSPDEVHRQFENAGVKCCLTIPELLPVIEHIAPRLKNFEHVIVIGAKTAKISPSSKLKVHDFHEIISSQPTASFEPANPDDVAVLPYSSGTTGLPKGVMLTHENCVINMEQLNHPKLTKWGLTTGDNFFFRCLSRLSTNPISSCLNV